MDKYALLDRVYDTMLQLGDVAKKVRTLGTAAQLNVPPSVERPVLYRYSFVLSLNDYIGLTE